MNLLASSAWILDVAFILILLLGILFGTWAGFIRGVCKLAGTIFAIFVALTFCNAFKNSLESAFGLTSAIASGVVPDRQAGRLAAGQDRNGACR